MVERQNSPGEHSRYPRHIECGNIIRADIDHIVRALGAEIKNGAITPTTIKETAELEQTCEDYKFRSVIVMVKERRRIPIQITLMVARIFPSLRRMMERPPASRVDFVCMYRFLKLTAKVE
jgi:hypothetical protein